MEKREFYLLDGMRGIAAILITLIHTGDFFDNFSFPESALAVNLFFTLSGAVIANAYETRLRANLSLADFVKVRLIRLYPLYIMGVVIGAVALLFFHSNSSLEFQTADIAEIRDHKLSLIALAALMMPNIFTFGSVYIFPFNNPSWSLFFEIIVNILHAAIVRFLTFKKLVALIVLLGLTVIAIQFFSPHHSIGHGWSKRSLPFGIFNASLSYFLGVFVYRLYLLKKPQEALSNRFMPFVLLAVTALLLMVSPPSPFGPLYEFLCISLFYPALVYGALFFRTHGAIGNVSKFLGLTSYAVYALHVPISRLLENSMAAGGIQVSAYAPYAGVLFLAAFVPFCWLIDKIYDAPVRRALTNQFRPARR